MPGPKPDAKGRQKILELLKAGCTYQQITSLTGLSNGLVNKVIKLHGGVVPKPRQRSPLRLSLAEREEIAIHLSHGLSFRHIGEILERSPSTICREVNNNGGRDNYKAWAAEDVFQRHLARPKTAKLVQCRRLQKQVQQWLTMKYSPRQISERLVDEFPDDSEMRISHEAIYQSLFIQGRGALRRELTACLRTGRCVRRSQHRKARPPKIKNMVMISERPANVEDRAIPGHWEGDLIIGKEGKSAIGTLVERQTRYVMLMKLKNREAPTVREALIKTVQRLPVELFKTLTWDQGGEMADHINFSVDTGVDVYFCDPHSPWQRGSNENTNGLLRQYFPKGMPLSGFSQGELDAVARELNDRPRQTLDWKKPAEKLAELLR